ncbi:MAG: radical SAM protein [Spirochaetaceae bacterium]|jgi:nitrogen fixation protein NifB|nr:radical SAM protein [Spirochaetaceae bacterium]
MYDEKTGAKPRPELKIANRHPCFAEKAGVNLGRIHLPVSPSCNIQCRFCTRSFNKVESRPAVARGLITPEEAPALVARALSLCPQITVAGIAGPGETLATDHALRTFALIHQAHPRLIKCLSTNGLMLERYVDDLWDVGVRTLTVTVNAVRPGILAKICAGVTAGGAVYTGEEGASLLIEAQKRGIRKAAEKGFAIKINIVLIPGINSGHIAEAARTVRGLGACIINIIPLIPLREFAACAAPDCGELARARADAEAHLPVFRHCRHCRADAAGILGKQDLKLYAAEAPPTFSHG